jgi:hypothetical protein
MEMAELGRIFETTSGPEKDCFVEVDAKKRE